MGIGKGLCFSIRLSKQSGWEPFGGFLQQKSCGSSNMPAPPPPHNATATDIGGGVCRLQPLWPHSKGLRVCPEMLRSGSPKCLFLREGLPAQVNGLHCAVQVGTTGECGISGAPSVPKELGGWEGGGGTGDFYWNKYKFLFIWNKMQNSYNIFTSNVRCKLEWAASDSACWSLSLFWPSLGTS